MLSSLSLVSAACISSGDQTTINNMFTAGGAGTVVQLCANEVLQSQEQFPSLLKTRSFPPWAIQ